MAKLSRLKRLQALDHAAFKFQRGIERETLRVDTTGTLSQTPHPETLGAALTHGSITTDYSEALLEFITGVHTNSDELIEELDSLHRFTHSQIKGEHFWAGSMPSKLPEQEQIPIAQYGSSHSGLMKTYYRHGLWHRYGRKMQTIAGLHYNWSLPDAFWTQWAKSNGETDNLQDFKTKEYFGLIRSFRRHSWLLLYLFGASPAMDKSFLDTKNDNLASLGDDTLFAPYATSLRMSDLGYSNRAQKELFVCFNSLESYADTLIKAIKTPYADYEKIGTKTEAGYNQLNTSILQIENEYYSDIRPKRVVGSGETPINGLRARGVEYIEVRCLDINPFEPLGINKSQMNFIDLFLLWCLVQDSPMIEPNECSLLRDNSERVALKGRQPDLGIYFNGEIEAIKPLSERLLDQIYQFAELIDEHEGCTRYREACTEQLAKVRDENLTPSSKILSRIKQNGSFASTLLEHSKALSRYFTALNLPKEKQDAFTKMAEQSWQEARDKEAADVGDFDSFLKSYFEQS
ncbi:glutamate--cysteine ligase [Reinekea forsetii]|nr:glutamate--cysteine ligase [Reinekea forsetii]